ncbi:MAG: N-formylglutamate amidohydrolase [Polyangiaceae bacterium]
MELYERHNPTGSAVPVVANLPHSGLYVPPQIAESFNPEHRQWLRNTDWFLPELYSFLPELGVTTLAATHSRYVVDLNRDPLAELHGSFARSLITKETAHGAPVYRSEQAPQALRARVNEYHAPYHSALRALLDETLNRFGRALLLDLHSFMGPITNDVCIGDVHGTSSTARTRLAFEDAFRERSFDVVLNQPFAGGYIVRAYANRPELEALQLELRYTNYLDCSQIDERRPWLEPDRIAAARARLLPALSQAIAAFTAAG